MTTERHWPLGPGLCLCGDRFRNPDRHLAHLRAFNPRVTSGPTWRKVEQSRRGPRATRPTHTTFIVPGHVLSQYTGLSLNPGMSKVICTCGWSRYNRGTFRKYAAEHARDLAIGIIYG